MAFGSIALADEFDGLNTADFHMVPRAECYANGSSEKEVPSSSGQNLIAWAPTGLSDMTPYPGCDQIAIRNAMFSSARPSEQAGALRRMFKTCGPSWERNETNNLQTLLDLSQIQYDLCGNPRMRRVLLHLPGSGVLRGFLALKPGYEKRPLVILRCGLLCNAGDISHRFMLMHLFDESPFNVLAIANVTGPEYVADNMHVAIGGFGEGMQYLRVAALVARSPLARFVSSYHIASVSLGSQGVLYASFLNKYNLNSGVPKIASALALCPVVDLRPSAKHLFNPGWSGRLAQVYFMDSVMNAIASVPGLSLFFPRLQADQIPDGVASAAAYHYAQLPPRYFLKPYENLRVTTPEQVWQLNRFLNFVQYGTDVPTLALASENDWVVETDVNAEPLARSVPANGNLNVIVVPRGNHCAINVAYGWETATEIYRSFVLSKSPELFARRSWRSARVSPEWFARSLLLDQMQAYARFEFAADVGRAYFRLKTWIADHNLPSPCPSPWDATSRCVRKRELTLPFDAFAPASWARAPRTEAEAQALTRFANANFRVVDSENRLAIGTAKPPTKILWESFD